MNGDKKTAPHEVASHGMPEEDFQRLKDLAETKYRSILQVVVSPDKEEVTTMVHYPPYFPANLQESAEAVGKTFDPETRTEEEIQQLYELWVRWNGFDLRVFAREFL